MPPTSDPLNRSSSTGKEKESETPEEKEEAESFSATGLDDTLDMMTLVTAKTDKASIGQQAAKPETHPEVDRNVYLSVVKFAFICDFVLYSIMLK